MTLSSDLRLIDAATARIRAHTLGYESVTFTVQGRPLPWQRPRTFVDDASGLARTIKGKGHVKRLSPIAEAAQIAMLSGRLQPAAPGTLVLLTLDFQFMLPKDASTRKHGDLHTARPDLDNLSKLVLEALTGVAYADDSQVAQLVATKAWGPSDITTVVIEFGPATGGAR